MNHVLGIDISKAKVNVALSTDNQHFAQNEFSNDKAGHKKLQKWLKKQKVKGLHACLEATGRYGDELAHFLVAKGYQVSVVNPSRISDYGKSKLRRNKNDQLDALLIADFCFTQRPDVWSPPSESQRELQELTRELATLKQDRQRKRNKLQSGLSSTKTRKSIERHIRFIDQEIEKLKHEIESLIKKDPDLQEDVALLTSIPGIGTLTAARFLAEVDVSRFQQAAQVAAYAGLVPREFSSGSSVRKQTRLSKLGNRHLRTAFFMPALSAHRFNPIITALVDRLSKRGKHKMVIIGAVMRKLVHLAFGVLKTRKPFDPKYLQNIPVAS